MNFKIRIFIFWFYFMVLFYFIILLYYFMRSDNFKLFDTPRFGLAHLARDGIHLNSAGKTVLSESWVNSILVSLRFRSANLPLRPNFVRIVNEFRSEPG